MIGNIPDKVDNFVLLTFVLADEIDAVDDFDKLMAVLHKEEWLFYYHLQHLVSLFVQLFDAFEFQQHCNDFEHLKDCHFFSNSE